MGKTKFHRTHNSSNFWSHLLSLSSCSSHQLNRSYGSIDICSIRFLFLGSYLGFLGCKFPIFLYLQFFITLCGLKNVLLLSFTFPESILANFGLFLSIKATTFAIAMCLVSFTVSPM